MPLTIKPTYINQKPISVLAKFASKIDMTGDCWEWRGYITQLGYGTFAGKTVHRTMWEAVGKSVDLSLTLDHLCRNKTCVNPNHLEQVTSGENTLRGNTKGAINKAKSHCVHGHPLNGDNLALKKRVRAKTYYERVCNTCNRRTALAGFWKALKKDSDE